MLESIPDYRKIVLLVSLFKNNRKLLQEIRFSRNDSDHLSLEFKNNTTEERENYLDYVEDQEESIIERIPNR